MMAYDGDGWVWCGVLFNVLAVVVFLGIITAAVVLAIHVSDAGRSGPSAGTDGGLGRPGQVPASLGGRGETEEQSVYRRLM